jgi:hypothetical protein
VVRKVEAGPENQMPRESGAGETKEWIMTHSIYTRRRNGATPQAITVVRKRFVRRERSRLHGRPVWRLRTYVTRAK